MKQTHSQIWQKIKLKLPAYSRKTYLSNFFLWDDEINSSKLRLLMVALMFGLGFLTLGYRLIKISSNDYINNKHQYATNASFRKEIVDRNGNLLAVNLPSSSLFANPQKVINPEESLEKLSLIIPDLNKKTLLLDLKSNKSFLWIKRDLTPQAQEEIFNLGLPGFDFEKEEKRIYTFGNLMSHILGYVGRDFVGLAGLEKSYNDFLVNKEGIYKKPTQEQPLELSIDVRLQNILSEEIEKTLKEFHAKGAVGIIADPNNGEVLALVNKPDFDPHYPQRASAEQLFNMSSLGVNELGSVAKALTMAIGFDTDSITMQDAYDISYMKIGKFQLKDYHPMRGWHTVPEIFLHSSNIGVSQIMLEVGKENLKKYFKALGLMDQLKIELPERAIPLFPSDSRWSDLSTVTMSYGYGFSVSPLHFVQAMLPVTNGGYKYPLTLIKRRKEDSMPSIRIFTENTSREMRKLFRLVVKEGTGKKAEVKGYLVGGKTGTAEKLSGKKYVKNSRMSSFFGVLPVTNPKYVIYIMFDEPKGNKESFGFATAGWTAAPAVGRVLERLVALYGLQPVDQESEEAQDIINVDYKIEDKI